MKKRTLQVTLHARESSVVELTTGDRVQLDRLMASPNGCIAERHGALLEPGVNALALAEGHYLFRTLSDTKLRVISGGVGATTGVNNKDDPDWPDSPKVATDPLARGDEPDGEFPLLTVE